MVSLIGTADNSGVPPTASLNLLIVCRLLTAIALLLHSFAACGLGHALDRHCDCGDYESDKNVSVATEHHVDCHSDHHCREVSRDQHNGDADLVSPMTANDSDAGQWMPVCVRCEQNPCDSERPGFHCELACSFVSDGNTAWLFETPPISIQSVDDAENRFTQARLRRTDEIPPGVVDASARCAVLSVWLI
jgi:hypothetical protein